MFRQLRILFALLLLLFVAASAYLTKQRVTSWQSPLYINIYPINGDDSKTTQQYIDTLQEASFTSIEKFMSQQALSYTDIQVQPFSITVSPQVRDIPPAPPMAGSIPAVMWWSMKLRFWAWTHNTDPGPEPDIQIFVLYYDPANIDRVPHSVGLDKGLIGVVHAFSQRQYNESNNIVIAHELMHTLGATDKYDLATNQPLYPQGYAAPDQSPLFPQYAAELMGGRIPLSNRHSEMPRHFSDIIIGSSTAAEIKWLK